MPPRGTVSFAVTVQGRQPFTYQSYFNNAALNGLTRDASC